MKELLEKYNRTNEKFREIRRETERVIGEALKRIPSWRDVFGSLVLINSGRHDITGDDLIPEVSDLVYNDSNSQVFFKIGVVSSHWVREFVDVGWVPLEWFTSPLDSPPTIPREYLEGKLERRERLLKGYKEDLESLKESIEGVESEIKTLLRLLGKEGD